MQSLHPIASKVVCLQSICMVDGSCTSTSQYSGCEWVYKDMLGQTQLMGIKTKKASVISAYAIGSICLGIGNYVIILNLSGFWIGLQRFDLDD